MALQIIQFAFNKKIRSDKSGRILIFSQKED